MTPSKTHRAAVLLGRRGGRATARALTPEQHHVKAQRAATVRWQRYYALHPDRRRTQEAAR